MALATEVLNGKKISADDYDMMSDYIRCEEYNNGLKDALLVLKNSVSVDEAIQKLVLMHECCEDMRYIVLKKMFSL